MNKTLLLVGAFLFFEAACTGTAKSKPEVKPNIIYILADDMGYGDLSCYGQEKYQTPNIDKLASAGIRFTQHYSGSTVCAPSRSALMTGMHTGHTPIRGNYEMEPEGQFPIAKETFTVAEMLKEAGYATGAFGKWGLGYPGSEGDPNKQGFDEFYGYNCQRQGHNYYPYYLWHNQQKEILAGNNDHETGDYAPELIHRQALKFMEDHKDGPFFLYYPSIIPHAELVAPESYMYKHRGKYEPEKIYKGVDEGPGYKNGSYGSQPEAHAAFAAMINLLDDQVGEIVAKLRELGIADNTLIIVTSDNGPHMEGGADPEYFNGNNVFRGFKRDLYEGGIRVPMITCWPGKIKAGQVSDHISAFWDMMPTFAELAGVKTPENINGISMLPTLLGDKQAEHDYLYWEFHGYGGDKQAIRQGKWKAVRTNIKEEDTPIELYDLSADPSEQTNIADQFPEKVEEMKALFDQAHQESDIFPFSYE